MRNLIRLIVVLGLLTLTTRAFTAEEAPAMPDVPVKGMVTMVDLGSDKCIPCKLMAPILKDLQKEYNGKAAILFIDVRNHSDVQINFRASVIPTQIFFDKEGKEFYRHEGFFSKGGILGVLKKAGVPSVESPEPSEAGRS